MKKTLSEERKEVENLLKNLNIHPEQIKIVMGYILKQDRKFIQEAQKDLKGELNERWNLYYGEEVVKEHIKIIDKVFKNKFGDLAK